MSALHLAWLKYMRQTWSRTDLWLGEGGPGRCQRPWVAYSTQGAGVRGWRIGGMRAHCPLTLTEAGLVFPHGVPLKS